MNSENIFSSFLEKLNSKIKKNQFICNDILKTLENHEFENSKNRSFDDDHDVFLPKKGSISDNKIKELILDFEDILLDCQALNSYIWTVCRLVKNESEDFIFDVKEFQKFSTKEIQNFNGINQEKKLKYIYDFLGKCFFNLNGKAETFNRRILQKLSSQQRTNLKLEENRLNYHLPIYSIKCDLLDFIDKANKKPRDSFLVVIGEAGSGKSTQIAQYLLESKLAKTKDKRIVITQPRKLAVNSVSKRVSEELGTKIGDVVGYHYGTTDKTSNETLIDFTTDHQLFNEFTEDRELNKYSCIIVDEAHERSVETDILIALLKDSAENRPDLKIIITSATINEKLFTDFFHNCRSLVVPGRVFPVQMNYIMEMPNGYKEKIVETVKECLIKQEKDNKFKGNILVFLPTIDIIIAVENMLKSIPEAQKLEVIQLHSKIKPEDSQKVFQNPPPNKKRVVLSTNIAEASVTVNNISIVIDSGLENEKKYNAKSQMSILCIGECPQSSCKQRAGRAGRTCEGVCFRLYSKDNFEKREAFKKPEIMRTDVSLSVLKLLNLKLDPLTFDFIEPPEKITLKDALTCLVFLEAVKKKLDGTFRIRTIGKKMVKLQLSPMLSKIILNDLESPYLNELCIITAMIKCAVGLFYLDQEIEEQSKNTLNKMKFSFEEGDMLTYLRIFNEYDAIEDNNKPDWCKKNSISQKNMETVISTLKEISFVLAPLLNKPKNWKIRSKLNTNEDYEDPAFKHDILKGITKGLFLNVCEKIVPQNEKMGYIVSRTKEHVFIHPSSVLSGMVETPDYFVTAQIQTTSRTFATSVSKVKKSWILENLKDIPEEFQEYFKFDGKSSKFHSFSIPNVPSLVLPDFSRRNFLEEVKQHHEFYHSVDFEENEIRIATASSHSAQELKLLITGEIDEIKRKYKELKYQELHYEGATKVILRDGGCIDEVLFRGESKSLTIKGLPPAILKETLLKKIEAALKTCGINSSNKIFKDLKAYRIEVITSAKKEKDNDNEQPYCFAAWNLSTKLDEEILNKLKDLSEILTKNLELQSKITVTVPYFPGGLVANSSLLLILNYSSFSGDGKVVLNSREINQREEQILNGLFSVSGYINRKNKQQYVFKNCAKIKKSQPNDIEKIKRNISSLIKVSEDEFKFITYQNPNIHSSVNLEPEYCIALIESIFSRYVPNTSKVDVKKDFQQKNNESQSFKRFFINFPNAENALAAFQIENGKIHEELCPCGLNLKLTFRLCNLIENEKYFVIREKIDKFLENFDSANTKEIFTEIKIQEFSTQIIIKSENLQNAQECMKSLRKLLFKGRIYPSVKLNEGKKEDLILIENAMNFIQKNRETLKISIETKHKVYIEVKSQIMIYGAESDIDMAIEELDILLISTPEQSEKISMKGINVSKLMKSEEFLQFPKKKDLVLIFNQLQKNLEITTNNPIYVEKIKSLISLPKFKIDGENQKFCSICLSQPKNAYFLICGHASCKICLENQISTFIQKGSKFPIKTSCCDVEMSIFDIMKILPKSMHKKLIDQAMNHFVLVNDTQYMKCPNPNCNQVFCEQSLKMCDFCDICCEIVSKKNLKKKPPSKHDFNFYNRNLDDSINFYEENENEIGLDDFNDENKKEDFEDSTKDLVQSFLMNKNLAKCLVCDSYWWKDGGSDHMTCQACDSHFCYRCEKVFVKRKKNITKEESNLIYQHIKDPRNCKKIINY